METSWPHKAVFALESATTAGGLYSLYFRAPKAKSGSDTVKGM